MCHIWFNTAIIIVSAIHRSKIRATSFEQPYKQLLKNAPGDRNFEIGTRRSEQNVAFLETGSTDYGTEMRFKNIIFVGASSVITDCRPYMSMNLRK